jgi:hypothetical protein
VIVQVLFEEQVRTLRKSSRWPQGFNVDKTSSVTAVDGSETKVLGVVVCHDMHPTDKGSWVQCDRCQIWIHVECAKINYKHLKDLKDVEYFCPDCKKGLGISESL